MRQKRRMKAFIRTISLILAIAVAGCGGSSSTSTTIATPIAFLFVVGQGANTIQAFKEVPSGEISGQPLSSFSTLPIPVAMALHPSKNFVYVANSTSNAVTGYSLNHSTGVLTPVGTAITPTPVGTNPVGLGVSSNGQFLYVLNQGSANISAFSIDTTRGLLTEIAGSPFAAPATAKFITVSPTAGFLYLSNGSAGTISVFSIASNGALTEITGSPFPGAAGANIAGTTIDAKGQFLYAADSANNAVAAFSIAASGGLAPVAGSPFAAGTQPVAIAVDSTGTLLYSANSGSNDVSAFKVSSGVLTAVTGSPFATAGSGVIDASQPVFLTVDPTNGFLYVANQGSRAIAAFTIKAADGTLSFVTNPPLSQSNAPSWLLSVK
jgi:6-phosphogluconolactonase